MNESMAGVCTKWSWRIGMLAAMVVGSPAVAEDVTISLAGAGKLRVQIGDTLFTEYHLAGFAKPILYPVVGPDGTRLTRNYPMRPDVAGEARDHPHHKSLWFTHGNVNGIDFWGEESHSGQIVHERILHKQNGTDVATLATENRWVAPDGKTVCTDEREFWFRVLPAGRAIDLRVTIRASHGDLTFGDTKEGTLGIRLHPNLRLTNNPPEVTTAAGTAVNSEGVPGADVWGKRARWVDYSGPVDGKVVGVAIFDHPTNPRHPTWWHARDYGLFAANPFGVHDFEDRAPGTGDLQLAEGETASFTYRILLHMGNAEQANVDGAYDRFANARSASVLPDGAVLEDARWQPPKDLNGYFPMHPPAALDEWHERAERIRQRVLVAAGLWPMPPRPPVQATVHGLVDRPEYTVEKVYLESLPGHFVTGNLYRPKGAAGSRPVVLSPHGHKRDGRFHDRGRDEVRRQIVEGAERFEVGGRYPIQARCVQLARMGCIVFQYDMLGYADSQQIPYEVAHALRDFRPHMSGPEGWGFFSTEAELRLINVLGLQTFNSLRALDWLLTLPEADTSRVGVTGASGGGTQTMLLSAIDPRVTVSMPAVMVSTSMQGGCTCENASCLRVDTGNIEFAALFAPKPLGLTAADDWTRELATKGLPELRQLYALYDAEEHVTAKLSTHFEHNYNYVNRAAMYVWFNRHLELGWDEPVVGEDYEPLSRDELTVWNDAHPPPPGGEPYERELVRQLARQSDRQLEQLTPRDEASWGQYAEVVGGALEVLLNCRWPAGEQIEAQLHARQARRNCVQNHLVVRNHANGAAIPVMWFAPPAPASQVAIVAHGGGKHALCSADGDLLPPLAELLHDGCAVVVADLFRQGGSNGGQPAPLVGRKVRNPRDFAGYTFGYNEGLFASRVQDLVTLAAHFQYGEGTTREVHLIGVGGAGKYVAAARAIAGGEVASAAVDTEGFRFQDIASWRDRDFLPGAVKYGDMPGLLALGAPHPLWLAGESVTPELTQAAYHAAGGEVTLQRVNSDGASALQAASEWLLHQQHAE